MNFNKLIINSTFFFITVLMSYSFHGISFHENYMTEDFENYYNFSNMNDLNNHIDLKNKHSILELISSTLLKLKDSLEILVFMEIFNIVWIPTEENIMNQYLNDLNKIIITYEIESSEIENLTYLIKNDSIIIGSNDKK